MRFKSLFRALFQGADLLANSRQKALRELLALSELRAPAKPQPNSMKEEVNA